jgi:hypothetical protein
MLAPVPRRLQPRHDQIAMQRIGGVFAGYIEVRFRRIAGDEEPKASLVHLQVPDAQAKRLWRNQAPLGIAHHAAGALLLRQEISEGGEVVRRNTQLARQGRFVEGMIIRLR